MDRPARRSLRNTGHSAWPQLRQFVGSGVAPKQFSCLRACDTGGLDCIAKTQREERLQAGMSSGATHQGNSHGFWPYLALAAGVLCISWSAIFVRWTDIPGVTSAFYRVLIPAVILLPTAFFARGRTRTNLRTVAIIAIGGLFFAADLALYNTAILRTSAAN